MGHLVRKIFVTKVLQKLGESGIIGLNYEGSEWVVFFAGNVGKIGVSPEKYVRVCKLVVLWCGSLDCDKGLG